jgi:hypothetical protein
MDPKSELLKMADLILDRLEIFVERVMLRLQGETIKILYKNNIVGHTQQLSQNIRYEVLNKAGIITGVVGVGDNVRRNTGSGGRSQHNYGLIRHVGRRPSPGRMPPVDEIQKWVIYKGLVRDSNKKLSTLKRLKSRSKMKRNPDPAYNQSRQIAWAIAKKIEAKGYAGFEFLEIALSQNIDWVAGEISNMKLI